MSLLYQMEHSQWLPAEEVERRQLDQLADVLDHAVRTVPYYRDTPGYAAFARRPLTVDDWRSLPVLSRAALQEAGPGMCSEQVPGDHLPLEDVSSTGSTGRPVRTKATKVTRLLWQAITLRDLRWHGRDLTGRLAAVRADLSGAFPEAGLDLPHWAPFVAEVYENGPCAVLGITTTVADQAAWLVAQDPDYLLSYPSNVLALAQHFEATGTPLSRLREVAVYGEVLTPEVRDACGRVWGVPVVDMYSSQEVGYLALQCPESERYHVQTESVLVEVIDDDGRPCPPGRVGRVVVSTLHNFATPLLRYELGDYAEVGDGCSCGRALPVLARVAGRQRNMWTLPGGERTWPIFGLRQWGGLEPIKQLQMVQHAVDRIEARIVGPRPLTAGEEAQFEALARQAFPWPFELTMTYLPEIDRSQGMKFEDFVSHVPAPTSVGVR